LFYYYKIKIERDEVLNFVDLLLASICHRIDSDRCFPGAKID
jgi:hypothetical protein